VLLIPNSVVLTMKSPAVTEEDVITANQLLVTGNLEVALNRIQELLNGVEDGDLRMRLLFDLVKCSALLDYKEITEDAIGQLEQMPEPHFSRALANMYRAYAEDRLGRSKNALALHDSNLSTGYFERDDFRIHKYQLYLFKAEAHIRLRQTDDALNLLDQAHALYPQKTSARDEVEEQIINWVEPQIQINRANCLMAVDRFEEAFNAASESLKWADGDWAALARQYMAECRLWQGRAEEALEIYVELKKTLPSRFVDEVRVDTGLANCMRYIKKKRVPRKPS
jgi:tetratricopeptide (TPR) repeat protein